MKIIKEESSYCNGVQIIKNDLTLFIRKLNNEYFRIETKPHSKKETFTLVLDQDEIENEIFEAFKELILHLNKACQKHPYSTHRIVADTKEHFIAMKSDTIDPNVLKFDYDPLFTTISITIYRNPKNNYSSNNCIILDREDVLQGELFFHLSELLKRLASIDSKRKPKVFQLFNRFTKKS